MENKLQFASVGATAPPPNFNVEERVGSARPSGVFPSVVLFKCGALLPTLKLGVGGFGKDRGVLGFLSSGNIFSIYRRCLFRAHLLERVQVARSGVFRAAGGVS